MFVKIHFSLNRTSVSRCAHLAAAQQRALACLSRSLPGKHIQSSSVLSSPCSLCIPLSCCLPPSPRPGEAKGEREERERRQTNSLCSWIVDLECRFGKCWCAPGPAVADKCGRTSAALLMRANDATRPVNRHGARRTHTGSNKLCRCLMPTAGGRQEKCK